MKLALALSLSCLLAAPVLGLPAFAQTALSQVGVTTAPPWNQTGQEFAQAMLTSDKFEIEASELAVERGSDPVRDFARQMIAAHTQSAEDVKAVADHTLVGLTITPPPVLDPRHMEMYRELEASYGPDFDRAYIAQQFDVHHEARDRLEAYAHNGQIWQLRRFARQMAPVIDNQLAMLRSLRGEMASNQ